ncbi:uncharacterized protein F4807DRAFT_440901 [Annulohypoxylon truncatum]|uniref:uncharacterized protein n=1 Tax=Annulohypoxylon truncatum TaxID=327061 RepID=UPI002008BC12|nr:uncharacterized protein F4807DRAFT_440901 [Annulohypoxylon truncatum]KAI1205901.1 hypothetical protein F4807DRAFT_440901 [Annulohypoxylon truncatum]
MEALVAVGLASNVFQFVEFSAKLISISNELRKNAASSENRDYRVIATHLETLSQKISDSAKAISQTSTTASSEEKDLQPVADKCCELAKSLLKRLETCGIQPGQNANRLQRARGAFRAIWNKREIGEISSRLEYFRSELILYYAFQTRKTQADQQGRQPSKDDIQAVLDKLDDLGPVIESVKRGINDKSSIQHSELLNSIAEARSENAQLHTRAAQQGLVDQTKVLDKLDSLHTSMATLNVGVQNIQYQQSSAIESSAQVKVENSTFLAGITQQVPLASDPDSSLRHALCPLLEEYKEKFLVKVEEKFRATARSELDNMLQQALPALDKMQYRGETTQRDHGAIVEEVTSETDLDDFESRNFEIVNANKQTDSQFNKDSLTMIYRKRWWVENRLGTFSLIILDRIRFDAFGIPTEVYELTVQFNPSPRWLSPGCSIRYESKTDARGSPEFGLRLSSHRVIDDNLMDEVHGAIERGDVSRIRDMLSQKIISTSDRTVAGATLLHVAVCYDRLEICKTLVQSGADINARNSLGMSAIECAIIPSILWSDRQGTDAFHYLLGLGVELEGFWLNEGSLVNLIAYLMAIFGPGISKKDIDLHLQDWMSMCRLVDFDLNIPGQRTFLECIVYHNSRYKDNEEDLMRPYDAEVQFDAITRLRIGSSGPANTSDIPVAYAAARVEEMLWDACEESLIAEEASPALSVSYRGYYAHPAVTRSLNFLEHVISKGIAQRPDCIFDIHDNVTISDLLIYSRWTAIWEGILEDHGFDVKWVYAEDKKRRRVVTGETTTHEVSVGADASKALEVKRRRGYENSDD